MQTLDSCHLVSGLFCREAPLVMLYNIRVIQALGLDVLSEDVSSGKVWKLSQPISGVFVCRHSEYLIQLLESLALGFWYEEEHAEESDDIPHCVPGECTLRFESLQ